MRNARKANLYFGVAGQYAVMSELLARGYNAARPEVDVGDDIISVRDKDGQFTLVQVKAANALRLGKGNGGFRAQFSVKERQIKVDRPVEFYFAFVIRLDNRWVDFILVRHDTLRTAYTNRRAGSLSAKSGQVTFTLVARDGNLYCGPEEWAEYRNNWDRRWPKVDHGAVSLT